MARNLRRSAACTRGALLAFLGQTKMAATSRSSRSVGFYADLNNFSSACYFEKGRNKKGKFFEVERVISSREIKKKVSS